MRFSEGVVSTELRRTNRYVAKDVNRKGLLIRLCSQVWRVALSAPGQFEIRTLSHQRETHCHCRDA